MTTRLFNGKRYTLSDDFPTKRSCQLAAQGVRRDGGQAICIKSGKRYLLYTRFIIY